MSGSGGSGCSRFRSGLDSDSDLTNRFQTLNSSKPVYIYFEFWVNDYVFFSIHKTNQMAVKGATCSHWAPFFFFCSFPQSQEVLFWKFSQKKNLILQKVVIFVVVCLLLVISAGSLVVVVTMVMLGSRRLNVFIYLSLFLWNSFEMIQSLTWSRHLKTAELSLIM